MGPVVRLQCHMWQGYQPEIQAISRLKTGSKRIPASEVTFYIIFSFQSRDRSCDIQLVQREMCSSDVPQCSGSSFYKSAPSDWLPDDTCATTEWSDWSPCSVGCGTGFRARTRRFFNRMGRKKCPHVDTVMKQTCQGQKDMCQDQVANIKIEKSETNSQRMNLDF